MYTHHNSVPTSPPGVKGVTQAPTRIPPTSHRYATPSIPWPWDDIGEGMPTCPSFNSLNPRFNGYVEVDPDKLCYDGPAIPPLCEHNDCQCWNGYPQSRFPNWTERQMRRSRIFDAIWSYRQDLECVIYRCDVTSDGSFLNVPSARCPEGREKETWRRMVSDMNERPNNIRARVLFVENMSGSVLRMLGALFNVEPFFFSSSINSIPSQYPEDISPGVGDHVTVTLTFAKPVDQEEVDQDSFPTSFESLKLDTQAPLLLYSVGKVLTLDLLSVHLVRNMNGSTIISYHSPELPATTASYLHKRVRSAGRSIYWQNMLQRSPDPTLVLLIFLWHAFCGWDAALESLHQHIMALENDIPTAQMLVSGELPRVRAHLLHYSSLLDHFIKAVDFIQETPTPFMTPSNFDQALLDENASLMMRECKNLRYEIGRLKAMLYQQAQRVKNLMIATDGEYMKKMAQATTRDGAAMKQIAYLTMIFLPPSFVAAVFGMNVLEISPDAHATIPLYIAIAVPLTVFTMWIVIAFQSKIVLSGEVPFWLRLIWPLKKFHARYIQKSKAPTTDHDIESSMGKRRSMME